MTHATPTSPIPDGVTAGRMCAAPMRQVFSGECLRGVIRYDNDPLTLIVLDRREIWCRATSVVSLVSWHPPWVAIWVGRPVALLKLFGIPGMNQYPLQVPGGARRQAFPRMLRSDIVPDHEIARPPPVSEEVVLGILPGRYVPQ